MKTIKASVLALLFLILIPSNLFAGEFIREENGIKCIDLEAAYADINSSSKALTGKDNSVDAVKKAQTVASLTNILSLLVGDSIYCINDEVAAQEVSTFEQIGILGQLRQANNQMIGYFPSVNITQHLAQEFVPGYGVKNSTIANEENSNDEVLGTDVYDGLSDSTDEVIEAIEQESGSLKGYMVGSSVQESGYNYLKDSLKLDSVWNIFRNLAYVFFIIVMIVSGFMIMFRKKLPGGSMVTLGNTITQSVLGVVLVTFSFAIVGVLMDFGKLSMNVVSGVFIEAYQESGVQVSQDSIITVESVGALSDQALRTAKKDGLITKAISSIPGVGGTISKFTSGLAGTTTSIVIQSAGLYLLTEQTETTKKQDTQKDSPGGKAEPALDEISEKKDFTKGLVLSGVKVGLITLLVRNVLLLLVALYASFKLFLTLLMTYVKLILNVIFGLIQIMMGSLPGNFSMIGNWFKSTVGNILVFVGIHLVVNLFEYLVF
jgi:hypothetical protein